MVQIGRGHRINELPNADLPFYPDIDTMLEEVLAGKAITPRMQLNVVDSGMLASARELYGAPGERTARGVLTDANVVAYGSGRNKSYLPSPQVITDYFRKGQHITAVGSRVGLETIRLDAELQVVSRILPKVHHEFDTLHETLQGVVENAYGAGQWRKGQYLRSNTPLLAGLAVQQAGIRQLPHLAYKSLRLFYEEWEKYGLRAPTDYPPELGRLAIGIESINTESTTEVLIKALRNENDIHARRTIGQTIVLRHGEAILNLAGAFAEELPPSLLEFKATETNPPVQPDAGPERIRTSREYTAFRQQEASSARPSPETRAGGKPGMYDIAVLQEPGVLMARVVQALGEGDDHALLVATMALSEQYNIGVPTALQVYPSLWKHQRLRLFNYVYSNKDRISEGRVTPAEARFIKTIHNEVQSPVSNRLYEALQAAATRTYNLRLVAKPFKELTTEAFVYNRLTAKATYAVQSEKDKLLLARLQARRAAEIDKLSKAVDKAGFKGQRSFLPPEVAAALEDAKRRPQELKRTEAAFRRHG